MLYEDAIRFSFPNMDSAIDAFETLQELGYEPVMEEGMEEHPTLHIHVERSDVQSALEIVQTHGGEIRDTAEAGLTGSAADGPDCNIEGQGLPAHLVNEDFSEAYMTGLSQSFAGDDTGMLAEGYRDSVYE